MIRSLAVGLLAFTGCFSPEELPALYQLDAVELVSHTGEPLVVPTGEVAVYDFIFTRCGATCPLLTSRMRDLTLRLDESPVRFVSVTVDPEYDSAEVLSRYRDGVTLREEWLFVTGEREEIVDLVVGGFKLGIGASDDPREPILHSTKFVLVDREGWIRGYYDSGDRDQINQLERDARRLARSADG